LELHLVVCVFGPQTLFSFLTPLVPSKTYMWNFECTLREMMIWSPLSNRTTWTTSCQPCSKKTLEHVVFSITFRWTSNDQPLGGLRWMFSPNLCPYSCKKIVGISYCRDLILQGSNNLFFFMVEWLEIGDLLHLSNNIFHSHGGLIHLKTNPRDKTKCSRFARKLMYSKFEKEKNSQFRNTTLVHHPSTLGLGVHAKVKGSLTLFFAPP
jgi:hypothetical protein